MQAGRGGAGRGGGQGEAGEGRHDEGRGGVGFFGGAEKQADAGAVDAGGVSGGSLGDDDAGFARCGDVGDGSEFEPEAADVDRGGALALTEEVGDGDLLRAEAFGDADDPLTADGDAWDGRLGEDASGRGVGGVETVFEVEDEAEGAGLFAGFGEGEAGEVGHFDLAAMDGEAHGDERGEKRDDQHGQGAEKDVEEAVDVADLHYLVRIYVILRRGWFIDGSLFVDLPLDLFGTRRRSDAAVDTA